MGMSMNSTGVTPRLQRALDARDLFVPLIDEPCPGVFVFRALTPSYCEQLLKEIEKHDSVAPNSMNKYGLVLQEVGLGGLCAQILTRLVNPLTRRFYPRIGNMYNYHGFIVHYDPRKQRSLDVHHDESDVTLNVCLGRKFTGGKLLFRDDDGKILAKIDHKVGQAVLHLGTHLHQAQNIRTGTRSNLILWCTKEA